MNELLTIQKERVRRLRASGVHVVLAGNSVLCHGNCFDVLPHVGSVQVVITDPPFGESTHSNHNNMMDMSADRCKRGARSDGSEIHYDHWDDNDIRRCVKLLHRICSGWITVITDYDLSFHWRDWLKKTERIVFRPIPFYDSGRSCRLLGDGPSSWTDWIVVARTKAQKTWGTLPGGYVRDWWYGKNAIVGGKPIGLMTSLVKDYSRVGDVVVDPCAGSGTTGVACVREGRGFVGIESNKERFDLMVQRVNEEYERVGTSLISRPDSEPVKDSGLGLCGTSGNGR